MKDIITTDKKNVLEWNQVNALNDRPMQRGVAPQVFKIIQETAKNICNVARNEQNQVTNNAQHIKLNDIQNITIQSIPNILPPIKRISKKRINRNISLNGEAIRPYLEELRKRLLRILYFMN